MIRVRLEGPEDFFYRELCNCAENRVVMKPSLMAKKWKHFFYSFWGGYRISSKIKSKIINFFYFAANFIP